MGDSTQLQIRELPGIKVKPIKIIIGICKYWVTLLWDNV